MNIMIPAGATTAQIHCALQNLNTDDSIGIGGVQFAVNKLQGEGGLYFNLKSKNCTIPMVGVYVTGEQMVKEIYAHVHNINRIVAGDDCRRVAEKLRHILFYDICFDPIDGCNHMFIAGGDVVISISQDNHTYSFGELTDIWYDTSADLAVCLMHHFEEHNKAKEQKNLELNCPYCGTVMEPIDSECSVLMAERVGFDSIMSGDAFDAVTEYHCTNEDCSKTVFAPK